jgi:hypothetical protein
MLSRLAGTQVALFVSPAQNSFALLPLSSKTNVASCDEYVLHFVLLLTIDSATA